jgi:hypothetical protein
MAIEIQRGRNKDDEKGYISRGVRRRQKNIRIEEKKALEQT